MKYNDAIEVLKNAVKSSSASKLIANMSVEDEIFSFLNNLDLSNSTNSYAYDEFENSDLDYNKDVPIDKSDSYEDSKSFDNKSTSYDNKQQDISSDSQGLIDSIAQQLTSARLQQAVILSEIVGKPRSKTRRKRRF